MLFCLRQLLICAQIQVFSPSNIQLQVEPSPLFHCGCCAATIFSLHWLRPRLQLLVMLFCKSSMAIRFLL